MLTKTHSTTGVQTPTAERKQPIQECEQPAGEILGFIDWITCTFPAGTSIEDLTSFLGGTWSRTIGGSSFYPCGISCGAILILYGGPESLGVNLRITGKGCRELEVATIKNEDWLTFLKDLLGRGASFSRLDVALDDHTGILDFDELERCSRAGRVSSRLKKVKYIDDGKTGSTDVTKSFIKYGSDSSDTQLKIYDKALEQGKTGHHVRVELVTKRKRAKTLVTNLVTNGVRSIPGLLAATVSFKDAGNDSHMDRRKTLPAWECFLGQPEKLRLSTKPSEPSLEKSIQTLEYQYGPTLAMIEMVYGRDRLLQMAKRGKARLTAKHFSILARYPKRREAC